MCAEGRLQTLVLILEEVDHKDLLGEKETKNYRN